jgi:peptide/nickel transport system permease protein
MSWKENWKPRLKEFRFSLWKIRKQPLGLAGLIIVIFYFILAAAAPLIVEPNSPNPLRIPKEISREPLPPTKAHPFGTTGPPAYSDIFYGVIYGTRTSIYISTVVMSVTFIVGLFVGVIAGYMGGKVEAVIMRITDIFFALPGLVLTLVIIAIIGKGLVPVMFALSSRWWASYARLFRAEVLRIKEKLFIESAEAIGVSNLRILLKHIIPNTISSGLILATLDFGPVVLVAASMGFLGLGLDPGTAEWGILLAGSRDWIVAGKWWIPLFPGIAITTFVLGWNLLGDSLRDLLDPQTRRLVEEG